MHKTLLLPTLLVHETDVCSLASVMLWCQGTLALCVVCLRSPEHIDDSARRGTARAVEMMSSAPGQPFSSKWSRGHADSAAGAGAGLANGSDRGANRDQRQQPGAGGNSRPGTAGGGTAAGGGLDPPVNLPAIKTSAGGGSSAAAANGGSEQQQGAAKFSLGDDDDELHEIQLDSAKAPDKAADKRD